MWGPFPSVMGVLGYRDRVVEVLTPFLVLCHIGPWPERGFDELVLELPTQGPGAPLLIRACLGLSDLDILGSGSMPPDHLAHHALLGASIAGSDPLGLSFLG
jgi:hypothetical protein